ncbi:MAG: alpha/beta fold hydrolase [Trebonia sp.]
MPTELRTERRLVSLPDGRDLDVLLTGPEDGIPLVIQEGTPIGLGIYPPTADAAIERDLRVILVARPGYERSTPRPGRRVGDVPEDIAAVLDHLGADTFVTYGASGGGPHALACAAKLPGRCLAAASVAGAPPFNAEGVDFLAGMSPENVAEFGAAVEGIDPLSRHLEKEAEGLRGVTGDQVVSAFDSMLSAADKAALTGEYASTVAALLRAAVSSGIAGWRDDDIALVSDWGFELARLSAPVAVWHGEEDRMGPFAFGQWLAAHIPGARTRLLPGEGHLSIQTNRVGDILSDLLDMAGLAPR